MLENIQESADRHKVYKLKIEYLRLLSFRLSFFLTGISSGQCFFHILSRTKVSLFLNKSDLTIDTHFFSSSRYYLKKPVVDSFRRNVVVAFVGLIFVFSSLFGFVY